MKLAIILAGGRGARLEKMAAGTPKPLIEIYDRPILFWVIRWLKSYGISDLIIGVAYRKERIIDYMKSNSDFGLNVSYSFHSVDDGTGTAISNAIESYDRDEEDFLVVNGDTITNVPIDKLLDFHKTHTSVATVVAAPLRSSFGIVCIQNGKVVSFDEKSTLKDVLINAGIYLFNRRICDFLENGDIETTTFPRMANERKLHGYNYNGFWYTFDTPKDVEDFYKEYCDADLNSLIAPKEE